MTGLGDRLRMLRHRRTPPPAVVDGIRSAVTAAADQVERELGILAEDLEPQPRHAHPYNKQLDLTKADWEKRGLTLPRRQKHVVIDEGDDGIEVTEHAPRSASSHLNHGRTTN